LTICLAFIPISILVSSSLRSKFILLNSSRLLNGNNKKPFFKSSINSIVPPLFVAITGFDNEENSNKEFDIPSP